MMRASALLWGMVGVLLVATALRFVAFGEIPPGLYHDEAYHGLDALDILRGHLSLYFPANNGREPLFIYLVALAVGVLGKSPFALRLSSFFVGVLTVAATGALGQAMFSRRVGALAAAVLAVTLWHVHLSRVGFRAVLLPLFTTLAVWQAAAGVKGERERGNERKWWRHWVAAGVFYGLSFYTYTAARFTPVAIAAFALFILATRPTIRYSLWRGLGLAALVSAVTLAPLAVYTVAHPHEALGRPGQVSILNPAINGGDFWGTLRDHTLRTLGMFFVRGDRIWRHNVPWRPVFDPLLGAAFALGTVVALGRVRRDLAAGLVLIWTAVMSLPTLLAEDAPHFLRAVGVLPMVAFLPALGLEWLWRIGKSARRRPLLLIPYFLLLSGLLSTTQAYFGDYACDPMTGYWFEHGAVTLAGRINEFLSVGWDGEQMVRGGPGERQVYLEPLLWAQWPQVRFLVEAPQAVTQISNLKSQISESSVAVFVWPYGEWQRAWELLPAPAEITVEEGPLSQGDLDPQPFTTYLAFYAAPPPAGKAAIARFSGGVELVGVEVMPAGRPAYRRERGEHREPGVFSAVNNRSQKRGIWVRLTWRATAPLDADYTVFLHYLRDGAVLAQADSRAAGGHYPTPVWRPGDVIHDDHYLDDLDTPLPGRDLLLFGFWQPESGAKLYLLDEAGNPAGDWIELTVDD